MILKKALYAAFEDHLLQYHSENDIVLPHFLTKKLFTEQDVRIKIFG